MKLMDRVKATLKVKRYSLRTEKTYCYWIRFFIRFHKMRHSATMAGNEVRQSLEYLAIERLVAAATQNQALNATVFLDRLFRSTTDRTRFTICPPCISPTRLLHSTHEQLDGVPVKSG